MRGYWRLIAGCATSVLLAAAPHLVAAAPRLPLVRREAREAALEVGSTDDALSVRNKSTGTVDAGKKKKFRRGNRTDVPCIPAGDAFWNPAYALVIPPCEPRPKMRKTFPPVGPKMKSRAWNFRKSWLKRSCEVFPGTRFYSLIGDNEIHNLQVGEHERLMYGELKTREECFDNCRKLDICFQVVWHKKTSACYLMSSVTKTEAGGQQKDLDFDSAVCGARACRVFDNYRKGNSGVPIDKDPAKNLARRKTMQFAPKVPPHLTTRPPHLDGFHPVHNTPFKAHAFRVGTYAECEASCIHRSTCKQAVYDKMDKLCELWTGRSNGVDSDGWPGKNKLYKSAACGNRVCELFENTRKALPRMYRDLRLPVGMYQGKALSYGAVVDNWEDCLALCMSDYHCLQTVYDSHRRKCYPVAVAIKDVVPQSFVNHTRYHSAHCFLSDETINAV